MKPEELRRCAMRLLEHPESYPSLPSRLSARIQMRIWKYPSFESFASWIVMADMQGLFVRRVVWDQAQRGLIEPVTYGAEAPIEAPIADQVISALSAVAIPLHVRETSVGLDGTRCGMEIGDHMSTTRLTWWEEEPPAWAPLRHWHAQTLRLLEARLPGRSAQ